MHIIDFLAIVGKLKTFFFSNSHFVVGKSTKQSDSAHKNGVDRRIYFANDTFCICHIEMVFFFSSFPPGLVWFDRIIYSPFSYLSRINITIACNRYGDESMCELMPMEAPKTKWYVNNFARKRRGIVENMYLCNIYIYKYRNPKYAATRVLMMAE